VVFGIVSRDGDLIQSLETTANPGALVEIYQIMKVYDKAVVFG